MKGAARITKFRFPIGPARCLACNWRLPDHHPACRWKPIPDPDPRDYHDGLW